MAQPATIAPMDLEERGRRETELERHDRNLNELLAEVRVAQTGVQILFAFLLIVPFSAHFDHVTSFQRHVYFATLVLTAIASALLISPTSLHRVLFRRSAKRAVVDAAQLTTLAGLAFMALAMTGVVMLVSDYLWGGVVAAAASAFVAGVFVVLWFAVPLWLRRRLSGTR
jgi:hypothetical protein